jgi:hypothetical protein
MPQTATRPVTHQTLKTMPKTETPAERNMRLHGCPLDHTPNAETIKAFNEPAIGPFDTLEEFFAALDSDD